MAVPKKKTSRSARDMRRAHDFLTYSSSVDYCPNCAQPKLRHRMCTVCGTWKGRQVGKNTLQVVGEAPAAE